jgi:hypothetical protein
MVDPKKRLLQMRDTPEMWAITKEAFNVLLGCTLETAGVEDPFITATKICFFGSPGSSLPKNTDVVLEHLTEDWARDVIDKVLKLAPFV